MIPVGREEQSLHVITRTEEGMTRWWSNRFDLFPYWAAVNETLNLTRTAVVGMLMGIAEVIPGVSGGTIAFLSGLYWRLLSALASIPSVIRSFVDQVDCARMARGGRLIFAPAFWDDDSNGSTGFRTNPVCIGKLSDSSVVFIHWDDLGIRDDHVGRRIRSQSINHSLGGCRRHDECNCASGLAAQLSDHPVALMIAGRSR